jgi:serine/threonine-protein kinase RsbW
VPGEDQDRFVLHNRHGELRGLAAWTEAVAKAHGLSDQDRFRVDLSVTEAVTNVIDNGFPEGGDHEIRIALRKDASTLTVEVTDGGRAFDASAAEPKSLPRTLAEAEPGGLGLRLMRHYTDALEYERSGGLNRLRLQFRLPGRSAAP